LNEDSLLGPINAYGQTNLMVEEILRAVVAAASQQRIVRGLQAFPGPGKSRK
jgi:UDP-glucose 4-epimerase